MPGTAKSRWTQLDSGRSVIVNRARDCANLTIPALLPPEGHTATSRLPTPYQGLGARGVNNLASKLLLALLPPNSAFFRLSPDDAVMAALGADRGAVEESLAQIERRVMRKIEASNLRSILHAVLKHLIVTGNALLHLPRNAPARMFRLNQYAVVRDAAGVWVELVIKEQAAPETIPENVRAACNIKLHSGSAPPGQAHNVDIYTHAAVLDGYVTWYQQINDVEVPGSRGRVRVEESPFIVLRWQAVENEDYGRGMVEEYLGDLISLEGLSKAILQFSAAAAKIIFLRHPNAVTDEDELIDAESGSFVTGRLEDIGVLQMEKYADFQVAKATVDDLTLRLSHAFLLQSGTVRNAERVTAEEIRAMAQELEDVLGGTYTVLSQELQLPLVRRLMSMMRQSNEIPNLAVAGRSLVDPVIVTGFDALGRGHELNRFRAFWADLVGIIGPEAALSEFSPSRLADRLATGHGVDVAQLKLTQEERAAMQQQRVAQTLLEKAAGPMAGAVAKGMNDAEG